MRKQIALRLLPIVLFGLLAPMAVGQVAATSSASKPQPAASVAPKVCERCIRAHEEFLASDAMQGRGSGTHDELVAATYVASQLRQYGIEPAGDKGSYIELVPTVQRKITSPPQLRITPPGGEAISWDYGEEFLVADLTQTEFSGPLRKLDTDKVSDAKKAKIEPGAVVLVIGSDRGKVRQAAFSLASRAAAILMLARDSEGKKFDEAGKELPKLDDRLEQDSAGDSRFNVLELRQGAFRTLEEMADGATVRFEAPSSDKRDSTWNVVGTLRGIDPSLQQGAILFSAHLDHLGLGTPVNGDNIYNGADDDASGTTAELEIEGVLGRGRRPRRTVIFALFGSE